MLHEVLMALAGYNSNFLPKVLESEKFLDPAEATLIKRVLDIASEFSKLNKFVDNNICIIGLERNDIAEQSDTEDLNKQPFGLYLQAFCNGVKDVLTPYHSDIIKLEAEALSDPYLPLLTVVNRVESHAKVFQVLNCIIKKIVDSNIHGCQILDFLHREMASNVDNVREALQCIIRSCHMVFFKQLSSWLLYGQLIDRYSEFFVQPLSEQLDGQTANASTSESFTSQDANCILSLELTTGCGSQESSHRFTVQYNMLPFYIKPSLAQKVLFIGETIVMFGCDPKEKDEISIRSRYLTSIWGEKEIEFFRKLQNLQAMKTFSQTEFEKTIDEFRSHVTQHLWKLAVEEAELFLQIKLMKDFFLLGRGELFLEFICQASPILQSAPVGTSTRDVNQAFHVAARKILINDEIVDKFSFVLPSKSELKDAEVKEKAVKQLGAKAESCWHLLKLTYKVSWPLHLLFDDSVLISYNKLFCFLLQVKKTQLDLHNVWKTHMECKKRGMFESEPAIWHLRNRLMFFVDNLQYYLQVDVLESQYAILQNVMQVTKDFEQVQKAHTLFQANVLSQTFLLTQEAQVGHDSLNPVQEILTKILKLCERFCCTVCQWTCDLNEVQLKDLDDIVKDYEYSTRYLLQLLTDLSVHSCGSHLSQLLLRLDFNRWFSSHTNITSP